MIGINGDRFGRDMVINDFISAYATTLLRFAISLMSLAFYRIESIEVQNEPAQNDQTDDN